VHPEKISLLCFFASYVVALAFEAAQLVKKLAAFRWLAVGFGVAGLFAQSVYLVVRSRAVTNLPPLLSSTHDWLLVLSWLAVLLYLFVQLVDRRVSLGLFVLPVVLALVGVSKFVSTTPDPRLVQQPLRGLGMFHASLLVIGMAGVAVGFVVSLMYLVQHRRLKQRAAELPGLHLLSLETLGRLNWWAVILSVPLLTVGMGTGVMLSVLSAKSENPVSLAHWVFIVSGVLWLGMTVLFVWLVTVRRPSGKLVAWRTAWACGFLFSTWLLLQLVSGGHGTG
jgi:ABC-type transport system involved in cytochrome c biogenesis permease subunit